MSEAITRSATTGPDLLASLDPLLREWLPRQRWFAGKGRPVTDFSLVAATELLPITTQLGLYHLLVRAHQPALQGPGDCYQLLIGVREALPPRLAPALIGHVDRGPLSGRTVYDALYDARPAEVLLEAMRTRARIGALRFDRDGNGSGDGSGDGKGAARDDGGGEGEIPAGLVARMVTSEQSNSSIVYGDTFILKLLRRVVPGVNPDLELPLALARVGCPRVPAPVAWIRADAAGTTDPDAELNAEDSYVLGVLQPFVRGAADGWELALRELAKGRTSARRRGRSGGPPPRCTWRSPARCPR